jgi:hypothetical protein
VLDDKKRNDADLSLGVPGLPGEDNVSLEDGRRVEQVPDHCLNFFQIFIMSRCIVIFIVRVCGQ